MKKEDEEWILFKVLMDIFFHEQTGNNLCQYDRLEANTALRGKLSNDIFPKVSLAECLKRYFDYPDEPKGTNWKYYPTSTKVLNRILNLSGLKGKDGLPLDWVPFKIEYRSKTEFEKYENSIYKNSGRQTTDGSGLEPILNICFYTLKNDMSGATTLLCDHLMDEFPRKGKNIKISIKDEQVPLTESEIRSVNSRSQIVFWGSINGASDQGAVKLNYLINTSNIERVDKRSGGIHILSTHTDIYRGTLPFHLDYIIHWVLAQQSYLNDEFKKAMVYLKYIKTELLDKGKVPDPEKEFMEIFSRTLAIHLLQQEYLEAGRLIGEIEKRKYLDLASVNNSVASKYFHNKGLFQLSNEKPDLAIREFEMAIELNSNQWQSHLELGRILFCKFSEKEESRPSFKKYYEQALRISDGKALVSREYAKICDPKDIETKKQVYQYVNNPSETTEKRTIKGKK
ncbi:MAG: hypothetical protein RIG77_17945 [Cyclobacteriaceae bacterium]